jgi:hypothetical protein
VATHKEFIFWHVAGCSRISCQMPHMLRRLQTELKAHFDLTREVSKDDNRLRWDLPTFLEMAARKVRGSVDAAAWVGTRAAARQGGLPGAEAGVWPFFHVYRGPW